MYFPVFLPFQIAIAASRLAELRDDVLSVPDASLWMDYKTDACLGIIFVEGFYGFSYEFCCALSVCFI